MTPKRTNALRCIALVILSLLAVALLPVVSMVLLSLLTIFLPLLMMLVPVALLAPLALLLVPRRGDAIPAAAASASGVRAHIVPVVR